MGLDPLKHDLRLVEDDWESPTLGAAGLGWQVWCDGTEISQFTYFQQCGGLELPVISAELTYGLDRIGMMLQGTDRVQDLHWAPGVTWGDLWVRNEWEWSTYNFEQAPVPELFEMFKVWEAEAARLLELKLVNPGYDAVIKCSHVFNLLDARGAISVSERVGYIARVRKLARRAAQAYADLRGELGYPLIKDEAERARWLAWRDEAAAKAGGKHAKQPAKDGAKGAGSPNPDESRPEAAKAEKPAAKAETSDAGARP
jgi:glycyl-tRNA synthetase alpha chain